MAQAEQWLPAGRSGVLQLHPMEADPPRGRRSPAASRAAWSDRDLTVLQLLADGHSTAAIAGALAYSESTVKNLVHDLVHRLGARNRTQAVALAIRAGMI